MKVPVEEKNMVLIAHQSYIGAVVGVWVEGDWKWGHHRGAHRMVAGFGKKNEGSGIRNLYQKKKRRSRFRFWLLLFLVA